MAHYRRLRDFSQNDLGGLVGIDGKNISRYESTDRQPTAEVLYRLCNALDIENPLELYEDITNEQISSN